MAGIVAMFCVRKCDLLLSIIMRTDACNVNNDDGIGGKSNYSPLALSSAIDFRPERPFGCSLVISVI